MSLHYRKDYGVSHFLQYCNFYLRFLHTDKIPAAVNYLTVLKAEWSKPKPDVMTQLIHKEEKGQANANNCTKPLPMSTYKYCFAL